MFVVMFESVAIVVPSRLIVVAVNDTPPLRDETFCTSTLAALTTVSDCTACALPTFPWKSTAPLPAVTDSVRLLAAASALTVELNATLPSVVLASVSIVTLLVRTTAPVRVTEPALVAASVFTFALMLIASAVTFKSPVDVAEPSVSAASRLTVSLPASPLMVSAPR